MPIKLNIGLSQKVGDNNYGSRGATVNVELEVESALANDPGKLQDRIRQVFNLVRASVAEELNGHGGHAEAPRAKTTRVTAMASAQLQPQPRTAAGMATASAHLRAMAPRAGWRRCPRFEPFGPSPIVLGPT